MDIIKLELTDFERQKISRTAKQSKFKNSFSEMLYKNQPYEKLELLLKCIRFIINLGNNNYTQAEESQDEEEQTSDYEEIKNKIKDFLNKLNGFYLKALNLNAKRPESEYGKSVNDEEINLFIIENSEQIDYIIDLVYELGKKVTQYDPEETQGYY